MIAGVLLAVGSAIAGSVAMLLKQRGVVAAPTLPVRHPCAAQSTCWLQLVDGGVAGRAGRVAADTPTV